MFLLDDFGPKTPRLPHGRWTTAPAQLAASASLHIAAASMLAVLIVARSGIPVGAARKAATQSVPIDTSQIVFIARGHPPGWWWWRRWREPTARSDSACARSRHGRHHFKVTKPATIRRKCGSSRSPASRPRCEAARLRQFRSGRASHRRRVIWILNRTRLGRRRRRGSWHRHRARTRARDRSRIGRRNRGRGVSARRRNDRAACSHGSQTAYSSEALRRRIQGLGCHWKQSNGRTGRLSNRDPRPSIAGSGRAG